MAKHLNFITGEIQGKGKGFSQSSFLKKKANQTKFKNANLLMSHPYQSMQSEIGFLLVAPSAEYLTQVKPWVLNLAIFFLELEGLGGKIRYIQFQGYPLQGLVFCPQRNAGHHRRSQKLHINESNTEPHNLMPFDKVLRFVILYQTPLGKSL